MRFEEQWFAASSHAGLAHVINHLYNNHASEGNGLKADTRLPIILAKQSVASCTHTHTPQQELNTAVSIEVTLVLNSGNRLF